MRPREAGCWCNKHLEVSEEVRKAWKEKAVARVEEIKDDPRPNLEAPGHFAPLS